MSISQEMMQDLMVGLMASVCLELDLIQVGFADEEARQIVRELPPDALARVEREIKRRVDFSGISTKVREEGGTDGTEGEEHAHG